MTIEERITQAHQECEARLTMRRDRVYENLLTHGHPFEEAQALDREQARLDREAILTYLRELREELLADDRDRQTEDDA